MAGLTDLATTSSTQTTTLPSWYSNAQENLGTQALNAGAPTIQNTAAQTAVNNLMPGSTTNPFATGRNILNTIGSGAANPWMTTTDASGNTQTVGNPSTAMGGLFNAQTDYLNRVMPNITATPEAANISSGNFGSLRGMTAVNKAKGDALANLFQQQNTAALQNQQTGTQAGIGLGTLGTGETQAALNTGTFQQTAPTAGLVQQANILNALKPGTTVSTVGTPSTLNQVGALGSMGQGLYNSLFGTTSSSGNYLPGIIGGLSSLFGGNTTSPAGNIVSSQQSLADSLGMSVEDAVANGYVSGSGALTDAGLAQLMS